MRLQKLTEVEFFARNRAVNKAAGVKKEETAAIKVFSGNTKITEPFFTVEANVYKWLVVVPKDYLAINWTFLLKGKKYTTYELSNDGVLFAFK